MCVHECKSLRTSPRRVMDCRTSSLSLVTVSMACLLSVGLHKPDSWNFSTEKELKAMCKSAASSPSLHFNEKINSELGTCGCDYMCQALEAWRFLACEVHPHRSPLSARRTEVSLNHSLEGGDESLLTETKPCQERSGKGPWKK